MQPRLTQREEQLSLPDVDSGFFIWDESGWSAPSLPPTLLPTDQGLSRRYQ